MLKFLRFFTVSFSLLFLFGCADNQQLIYLPEATSDIEPLRVEVKSFDIKYAEKMVAQKDKIIFDTITKEHSSLYDFEIFCEEVNKVYEGYPIAFAEILFDQNEYDKPLNKNIFFPTIFHEGMQITNSETENAYYENEELDYTRLNITMEYVGDKTGLIQSFKKIYMFNLDNKGTWHFDGFDGDLYLANSGFFPTYLDVKVDDPASDFETSKNLEQSVVVPEITTISHAQAKDVVLKHSGNMNVLNYVSEIIEEQEITTFNITFTANSYDYQYTLNADDGAIIKDKKQRSLANMPKLSEEVPKSEENEFTIPEIDMSGISEQYALDEILKHSELKGVTLEQIGVYNVLPSSEGTIPTFEISFDLNKYNYIYTVDRRNGNIIKTSKKNASNIEVYTKQDDEAIIIGDGGLTVEQAVEIARKHANILEANNLTSLLDENKKAFLLNFENGDIAYEYQISSVNGAILIARRNNL